MTKIPTIMEDKRTIKSISSVFEHGDYYSVGNWLTKIEPYEEHGQGSMVTWFAVYAGDEIVHRIPAATYQVYYGVSE